MDGDIVTAIEYLESIKKTYPNDSQTPILHLKRMWVPLTKKEEYGLTMHQDLYICDETKCYVIVELENS